MGLLSKNKKDNEQIEKIEYDLQGMTYTEFVSQELTNKLNELKEQEKDVTNSINEVLGEIKTKGSDGNGLAQLVSNLRKKHEKIIKEIENVSREYAVDFNLIQYANALDKADSENKGRDLILDLIPKINEIISMLPEIVKYYGNEYYAPFAYSTIKRSMEGLVSSLNVELPKLQRIDKDVLLKHFNERLVDVENEKREKRAVQQKYANLLT